MTLKKYYNLVNPDNSILYPEGCPEFNELSSEEVRLKLVSKIIEIKKLIDKGILPYIDLPLRRRENIIYDNECRLFLGPQTYRIEMDAEYNQFGKTISMAKILHEVLLRDIHSTKRDMFYQDVNLFENQTVSDKIINDLATWLGCSRPSMNITASSKGVVIGKLEFTERGDFIDCRKVGSGKSIVPDITMIDKVQSDAEFILVVEKDAIFNRLAEDKFYDQMPSIIVTAKGQPDRATRAFIKKLVSELKIPVFGLMDADVYGLSIMSTYTHGSVQMAYETPKLCHNNNYWLGLRLSQFEEHKIPANVLIPINENDKYHINRMIDLPSFKRNKKIIDEMELMLEMGVKAEIQALNAQHPQYVSKDYIPNVLSAGDIIKF